MPARAMWTATLALGGVELPIKLYAAVEDRTIHFHLLSPNTGARVRQRMVDPDTGREVPTGEIRRAYQVEPGRFVVLDAEELDALRPEPSRRIEILRFVDRTTIDHRWYARPYYLGPGSENSRTGYFALATALAERGEEGVARWVMRGKAYAGSLHERDGYLMLVTLRAPDRIVPLDALSPPDRPAIDERERELARQLVDAYASRDGLELEGFRNEYRAKLRALIEARAAGAPVTLRKLKRKRSPSSLVGALEKSLAAARTETRSRGSGPGKERGKQDRPPARPAG